MPLIRLILIAIACQITGMAYAQDAEPPVATVSTESQPAAELNESPPQDRPRVDDIFSGDVIYLRNKDGKLVPVLKDQTLEEFLRFIERQNQTANTDRPEYYITSVILDGTADEQSAFLTARFAIEIKPQAEDAWVDVPLALNEATLIDIEHAFDGTGDQRPQLNTDQTLNGLTWSFRGQGRHHLTLTLKVPIKKQHPIRRLQLALPQTAVSSLSLVVPLADVRVTTPRKQTLLETRKLDSDVTRVEAHGLTNRLDIQWQIVPDVRNTPTILQADTTLTLQLTEESAVLTGVQKIQARQGSFDEITVALPPSFELRNVEGRDYSNHRDDPNNDNYVIVQLSEPTVGPVTLRWTFESQIPEKEVVLSGLRVVGAQNEKGEIRLIPGDGYRLSRREQATQNVISMNVGERGQDANVKHMFQFHRQPFRLALGLQEIEPYFSVDPQLFLELTPNSATLHGLFRFDVYANRGALKTAMIRWPRMAADNWNLELRNLPVFIDKFQIDETTESIQFLFVAPQSGQFTIPIIAHRSLNAEEPKHQFSLPSARASRRLPTKLAVGTSENVIVDLQPVNETELLPAKVERIEDVAVPFDRSNFHRPQFRQIPSESHDLTASITTQKRSTTVAVHISLEQMAERTYLVRQVFDYDIEYGRLSQVGLQIPDTFPDSNPFAFQTEGGEGINSDIALTPSPSETSNEVLLKLPESSNQFRLICQYQTELPTDGQSAFRLPIVTPTDGVVSSTRLHIKNSRAVDIRPTGTAWQVLASAENDLQWIQNDRIREIPLSLESMSRTGFMKQSIPQALMRIKLDQDGFLSGLAQYQVDSSQRSVNIQLPHETTIVGFWIDKQPLDQTQVEASLSAAGEFQIRLPAEQSNDFVLVGVEYRSTNEFHFDWTQIHEIPFPKLGGDVWIDQLVWQIALPADRHLFSTPRGWTPQFRWVRQGMFWSRQTQPILRDLDAWIGAGVTQRSDWESELTNRYVFNRVGPSSQVRFASMSQSLVIIFGAGFAFVLSWLLLKLRFARHILTLLTVLCGVVVLAMLFPAPVKLLLQPAALGLLVAAGATLLDSLAKSRKRSPALSVAAHSDFVTPPSPPSSLDGPFIVEPDHLETTETRPYVGAQPEALSSSESGTGSGH